MEKKMKAEISVKRDGTWLMVNVPDGKEYGIRLENLVEKSCSGLLGQMCNEVRLVKGEGKSKYKEQDKDIKKADKSSRELATHLYHMGAGRIEEDIHISETSDMFRLTLERIFTTSIFECKCGHTEEISINRDIEWHVCEKCGRKGLWRKI